MGRIDIVLWHAVWFYLEKLFCRPEGQVWSLCPKYHLCPSGVTLLYIFPSWPYCGMLQSPREPLGSVQAKAVASRECGSLALLCSPQETARQALEFVWMRVRVLLSEFGLAAS